MTFYVQQQNNVPLAISGLRTTDDDIEIEEATALLFYTGEESLDDWQIIDGCFVRDEMLKRQIGNEPLVLELDTSAEPKERDLMISLVPEQQAIDLFFDLTYRESLIDVETTLYVDDAVETIRFNDFSNGHYRVHAHFTEDSVFKITDQFRSVGLVKLFNNRSYRTLDDRVVRVKVEGSRFILPQHLYHMVAYYAHRNNPYIVLKSELISTEAQYNPDWITVVGSHELKPA